MAVVGLAHANSNGSNRKFEALVCAPGEPVELVPEPRNKVDPQAIAVFSARGVQLGYLSGEKCGWMRSMLARGEDVRAIFQRVDATSAVIRVAIGGRDPTLPAAVAGTTGAAPSAEEPDWYPDEIPPDDFG